MVKTTMPAVMTVHHSIHSTQRHRRFQSDTKARLIATRIDGEGWVPNLVIVGDALATADDPRFPYYPELPLTLFSSQCSFS